MKLVKSMSVNVTRDNYHIFVKWITSSVAFHSFVFTRRFKFYRRLAGQMPTSVEFCINSMKRQRDSLSSWKMTSSCKPFGKARETSRQP